MSGITHAGIPSGGLTSLCPNVTDLDLSRNQIGSWDEVMCILRSLDKLQFVNLSGNRLQDPKVCIPGLIITRFFCFLFVLDLKKEGLLDQRKGIIFDYLSDIGTPNGWDTAPCQCPMAKQYLSNSVLPVFIKNYFELWLKCY